MTKAQICLYHIAENMKMDKSISKEGYEYFQQAIKALEQEPLTEEDYIELRDRFGEYVEFVVRDMVSGKGERWKKRSDKE